MHNFAANSSTGISAFKHLQITCTFVDQIDFLERIQAKVNHIKVTNREFGRGAVSLIVIWTVFF
jgi:hypothetical protein